MADLTLILGNRNYSSWSLRAYLAARQTGVPCDEVVIPLHVPGAKERILEHSPSGLVPALRHGEVRVWESLAIIEYLAEVFPAAGLWPATARTRALARSVSAEMHAGFTALRRTMPLDMRASRPRPELTERLAAEIDRVAAIWRNCRANASADGPFLFGAFSAADAMYAPVVSRFRTYGVALDGTCQAYADALWAHPPMRAWYEAACREPWVIEPT